MNTPAHAPHAHSGARVGAIMATVMLALAPATLFGFYLFGWPAIWLWLITVGACLVLEVACLRLAGRGGPRTLWDGSALLAGWLLALTLPPWAPWWIGVIGAFAAIVVAKHAYGGLGQNPFNPAMVGRVALLISFPLPLTTWVRPAPLFAAGSPGPAEGLHIVLAGSPLPDAMTSATLLGHVKTEATRGIDAIHAVASLGLDHAGLGWHAASLGESATWLILAGGLFLIARRIITWHIPAALLAGLALPAAIAHAAAPEAYLSAGAHLTAGAAMLGAFFIATDLVTSPATPAGRLIFGAGVGLLTWVIRTYAGFPEGLGFAVLLMNAGVPLIDRYTRPRIYGHGQPVKAG
jgi:RnfABCDGE-type electron transport complex D subunit